MKRFYLPAVAAVFLALQAQAQPTDNVGIGATTPASTLTVKGQAAQPVVLLLETNASQPLMRINSNNQVGVGANFPAGELHVRNGTGFSLVSLQQRNPQLPATMSFSNIDGLAWNIRSYVPPAGMFPDGRWQVDNLAYGNVLTLRGNATVGINNPNPVNTLDINGNLAVSGQIKPNGNSGNAGDLLYSEGPGKAPVWKTPINTEYNNYLLHNITNTGFTGPGGSGYPPAANVITTPFSLTDTAKVEVMFGLRVQARDGGTAYGYMNIELWQQSPATMLDRHRVIFKAFSPDISWTTMVNTSKVFTIRPLFGGTTLYEIRASINWSDGASLRYGNGIVAGGPSDSFCHLRLMRQ